MSIRIAVRDADGEIAGIAERVAHAGERVVVERGGQEPVAVISMADLAQLEASEARDRTERQKLLDDLVRMDDEDGLYAREAEEAARAAR
jgi:hypothetical protein